MAERAKDIEIDEQTAVIVAAGPSLDRLSSVAWSEVARAGALVAVNGAFMATTCLEHDVRFTHVAAMTSGQHMEDTVPGFLERWRSSPAWRLTRRRDRPTVMAETYVRSAPDWSDDPERGYFGGSSAMSSANWLHNDWPRDHAFWRALLDLSWHVGKPVPRRGYRKFVYLGLDMVPNQGGHARGAGSHISGFTASPEQDAVVRTRWGRFCEAAATRGSRVLNLSPGTGLREMPHREPPRTWLRDAVAAVPAGRS